MSDAVAVLRGFNRAYTQRIGVLDESYLGTGRPLGPSRVLFEVDDAGTVVADLRRSLGLDSGYLSRLLRQLESEGLVTVERDPDDGRRRIVTPTAAGRRERTRLERRSQRLAESLVEPLSPRRRDELAQLLATAERIIRSATVTFTVVDPRSPEARSAVDQYFAELDARFESGFAPERGGANADAESLRGPTGAFVIMWTDELAIGCGGVQRIDDQTAEIKRMWIHPDWRGLGLGARLLDRLEAQVAELDYTRVVLDTNESLDEAIALYGRSGYTPTERYNDNPYANHWFEKHLG